MKVLYLYTEVMGYTLSTIQALSSLGAEVHLIHWDHKKLTPFKIDDTKSVYIYNRSEYSLGALFELCLKINPDITVVSGWQDKSYLPIAYYLRRKSKVVCGLDGQWDGTFRQYIASLLGLLGFFRSFYSHAWIAGRYQYEYARKLGFRKASIAPSLYSADYSLFTRLHSRSFEDGLTLPHRFLYIGRFEPVKGISTLINAWNRLSAKREDWELCLIGNGSMNSELASNPGIIVKNFIQPHLLVNELRKSGCFILPSLKEPWGVVLHESACSGLPLIASNVVGSAAEFLIHDYNGFVFESGNADMLAKYMLKIIRKSDQDLAKMGSRSAALSSRITPSLSAASLLGVLPN